MSKNTQNRRIWAVYAAFLLHWIFNYIWTAFIRFIPDPDRLGGLSLSAAAGMVCGGLLLPLVLPMRDLIANKRPGAYYARLSLMLLAFFPGIVFRFLGIATWFAHPVMFAVMSFFTNIGITLVFGLFICLCAKNRAFWACFSISIGFAAFYLPTELIHFFPSFPWNEFFYYFSGLILALICVLAFLFLLSIGRENGVNDVETGYYPISDVPARNEKRFSAMCCLVPVLAVFVIFSTNSFTERLFYLFMQLPLKPDVHFPAIITIALLPFLGFFADRNWKRFLELSLPVCTAVFILTPSLLLFGRSDFLFLVLYTFTTLTVLLVCAVFPFIIVDLYKNRIGLVYATGTHSGGYWIWFLAVSVHLIRVAAMTGTWLLRSVSLRNAFAVTLLSLAAIAFYVLSRKSISLLARSSIPATDPPSDKVLFSSMCEGAFREHGLTGREIDVAALIVDGMENKEIARRLFIATITVKSHLTSIYKKFNVKGHKEFMTLILKLKRAP